MFTPSKYQQAIYDAVSNTNSNSNSNLSIRAVAGSGKSTTMVHAASLVSDSVCLAFNKTIAEELKARGVNAKTFHSLCFGPVLRHLNVKEVQPDKIRQLLLQNEVPSMYISFVQRLIGLGRQAGMGIPHMNPPTWVSLVDHHDLELESEEASISEAIELAQAFLEMSSVIQTPPDFDDLLYLAVRNKITLPRFDFVFVDEAQDTNAIQRAILRKIMRPSSRIVVVGDPAQAIYGFRGADSDSMDLLSKEFDCTPLPLTVSYRCAKAIVKFAQKWVPDIEAGPQAQQGAVNLLDKWNPKDFSPQDLVVCRTTRPLVTLAFRLLRENIPARILGKDIGANLKALVTRMKARDISSLSAKLAKWREREVERNKDNEGKVEAINDKVDTLFFLMEEAQGVADLLNSITTLFSDNSKAVTFATIHKSKGLEADKVWWLNSSKCPSTWARQAWQQKQEENLCYVAATRAKLTLNLIEEKA